MGGSSTKPQKEYPKQEIKIQNGSINQSRNVLPPVSPSNKNANSGIYHKEQPSYISRYENIPEDRLHKTKFPSVKMIHSVTQQLVETKVKVKQNQVTVKQQRPLINSTVLGKAIPGFNQAQFQNKSFKKFSITAILKEKDLIKQSNYFDESHFGEESIHPVMQKERADFRMGHLSNFQTFQVKTYLYDRNLNQKLRT